jgi:hypothetical protein
MFVTYSPTPDEIKLNWNAKVISSIRRDILTPSWKHYFVLIAITVLRWVARSTWLPYAMVHKSKKMVGEDHFIAYVLVEGRCNRLRRILNKR